MTQVVAGMREVVLAMRVAETMEQSDQSLAATAVSTHQAVGRNSLFLALREPENATGCRWSLETSK